MTPKEKAESLIDNYISINNITYRPKNIRSAAIWSMWEIEKMLDEIWEHEEEYDYYSEVFEELKTFLVPNIADIGDKTLSQK